MEILKDKDVVNKILNKLKQLGGLIHPPVKTFINPLSVSNKFKRLPEKGFLAGGAICNTILSLIDGKDYPINDIDIFYEVDFKICGDGLSSRSSENNLHMNNYEELMSIENRGISYSIVSTEIDGIFNYVNIRKIYNDLDDTTKYSHIIRSFDINCTMVGIDLVTNELVYTKEFEEFIRTRQLMVCNPYTPCHSSLRLIKKRDELGCYLDIDKEMRFLSQIFNIYVNPYTNDLKRRFGNFFSEKYKDLYDKYKDIISEYFEMINFVDINERKYKEEHNSDVPLYLLKEWSDKSHLHTLIPIKYNTPEKYLSYIPESIKNPLSVKKLWDLFERSNKSDIKKAEMVLSNEFTRHFFFVVDNFYKCDFNEKNVEEFNKILKNKNIFLGVIKSANLNLQETLNFSKVISNISNKGSHLFVDIILDRIMEMFGNVNKDILMDTEFIKSVYESEKQKRCVFLTNPLNLEEFEFKSNVYELLNEYDLMYASRILHNCMANTSQSYISKIKSGKHKLFLIETENSYSGLEILYNGFGFTSKTLLGINNENPCEKHVHISNYLINYLNHQELIKNRDNTIKKLEEKMSNLSDKVKNSSDTLKQQVIGDINRFNVYNINDIHLMGEFEPFNPELPF